MDQIMLDKQRTLRGRTPIILLSVFAVIFSVLYILQGIIYYDQEGVLTIGLPGGALAVLEMTLNMAPSIVFLLYILLFHKKFRAAVLVPITFTLMACESLYHILFLLINERNFSGFVVEYMLDPRNYYSLDSLTFICYTLAAIGASQGFLKKYFLISAVVAETLLAAQHSFLVLKDIVREQLFDFYSFTYTAEILWRIDLLAVLILFVSKNVIPPLLFVSPEKALTHLKKKFEDGKVTDAECKKMRADIIRKI